MLYVYNELSYDRFNEKADRTVRVIFRGFVGGGEIKEANVMPPVAETLKKDYPEVLESTRLLTAGTPYIIYGNKAFREDKMAHVDSNFFDVFSIPFLQGDPKTALTEPNTMVISRAVAEKYFGKEDPIGKVLNLKSWKMMYKVTGVFDKIPANSHFHFDLLASMADIPDSKTQKWMISSFFTYLVLPEDYDYKKLEAKLPQVSEKYMGPQVREAFGMSYSQFKEKGNKIGLYLQPLTDIHLRSDLNGDIEPGGDIRYVYIFAAIAVFMLLIAGINFVNLSTAGASKRAMEVGVRKVLGSMKVQLIKQFLVESTLLSLVALALSFAFAYGGLLVFNDFVETDIDPRVIPLAWFLPGLLLFGLLVGALAGVYPAFYLSSFKPVSVLKGKFTSGKGSISFRSALVVFQFFISISLILGTIIIYKQLSYIQNKKLGYNKDQVIAIHSTWLLGDKEASFADQLAQLPGVKHVSTSSFWPAGNSNLNNYTVYPDNKVGQYVQTPIYKIDNNYLSTMGIELAAGRNFSKDFGNDSLSVIINETAAKAFGWGDNALGHTLTGHTDNKGTEITYRIIGVVKDFHYKSLHEPISPMMMFSGKLSGGMTIKAGTEDIAGLLASMKKLWAADDPFTYSFMDERFKRAYNNEQTTASILGIFAGLTIFVACLGLFGLTTFTVQQRTKEIGVRKVLGASVTAIATLLSKDFIKLVLIALVLASPVAWYVASNWLQDFAYRIDISWWMFVLAGITAVIIALVTVSFQAIKAALINPVKSLRSE
jgi:putative ABC transport system permease protein